MNHLARSIWNYNPKKFLYKKEEEGHNKSIQTRGGRVMNKNKPKKMFAEMMDKVKKMFKKVK